VGLGAFLAPAAPETKLYLPSIRWAAGLITSQEASRPPRQPRRSLKHQPPFTKLLASGQLELRLGWASSEKN